MGSVKLHLWKDKHFRHVRITWCWEWRSKWRWIRIHIWKQVTMENWSCGMRKLGY